MYFNLYLIFINDIFIVKNLFIVTRIKFIQG
jgi:hypothetical protein